MKNLIALAIGHSVVALILFIEEYNRYVDTYLVRY